MQRFFHKLKFPLILVAAVLVFALAAVSPNAYVASAEDEGEHHTFTVSDEQGLIGAAEEAAAGEEIILNANITITVVEEALAIPAGVTLTVPSDYTLTVAAGATLNANGDFVLNGVLSVKGNIIISGAITTGSAARIDLAENEDITLCPDLYAENGVKVSTKVEFTVGIEADGENAAVRWAYAGGTEDTVETAKDKYAVILESDDASIQIYIKITPNNIQFNVELYYANPSSYEENKWQTVVSSSATGSAGAEITIKYVLDKMTVKPGYHFLHAIVKDDPNNVEMGKDGKFLNGKSNNSATVKLYFARDQYYIKLATADEDAEGEEGFITEDEENKLFELGDSVYLTAPGFSEIFTKVGYKLAGWQDGVTRENAKLKTFKSFYTINGGFSVDRADGEDNVYIITLSAVFEVATDTPYKVERYLLSDKDADVSAGVFLSENTYKGTTNATPKIQTDYAGYSFVSSDGDLSAVTVNGNGETVVKLYYVVVKHVVSYEGADLLPADYIAGDEITLPAAPAAVEGKTFNGWLVNGALYGAGTAFTMPAGNVTVKPSWTSTSGNGGGDSGSTNQTNNPITVRGEENKLSAGAIAGIVIGSAAALSIAVFAILWFGVKKKSFADIAKLFKKPVKSKR